MCESKKYTVGYLPGTFDLFHIGHLNIIKRAKERCDYLICAVSTDDIVLGHKGKSPIIPFDERIEIVRSIKYVDSAVPQLNQDKLAQWLEHQFDVIFAGDDLESTPKWLNYERLLKPNGVNFIYFDYTKTTSSTLIAELIRDSK